MQLFLLLNRWRRRWGAGSATQQIRGSLAAAGLYLLTIFVLHVVAMALFDGMPLDDAAWLTATTLTTVGYGDYSAATTGGRLATVLLLYVGGIFVLAKVVGDYFDYRVRRRELRRKGEWDWKMRDHLVIINAPRRHAERYFARLLERLRGSKAFRECPIQLLNPAFPEGLPASIASLGAVVQTHGGPEDPRKLASAQVTAAKALIVLATDEYDPLCDSFTFDTVHRLKELGVTCPLLAECVDDDNRERLLRAGAANVTRPIRAYPGMLVRSLIAPGSETVVEDIFRSGTFDFRRFEVAVTSTPWRKVVRCLLDRDIGTAVAYVLANNGRVVTHPAPDECIEARALLLLVDEDKQVGDEEVRRALGDA